MSEQEMRDPRIDPEDKLEAVSLTETSPTIKKLDNFWYHNKWTVIVVTFFVAVGIVCLVQFFLRPEYDTSVAVACRYRMNREQRADFEALMQKLCPEDFSGDGEIQINITDFEIYSEEEIESARDALEAESDRFAINMQYNTNQYQGFNSHTLTGETAVYFVSPMLYQRLLDNDRILPLAEMYGEDLPMGAREDGCGIDLVNTDLYLYNPALQVLPDSTILCILRPGIAGKNSNSVDYENEKAFFCSLADFRVEE